MACFEDQVRDRLKIEPRIAKAFMTETLQHMKPRLENGVIRDGLSVADAMESVASRTGLSVKTVARILQSDAKLFSISKQAFARQAYANKVRMAAQALAENGPRQPGAILRSYNDLRRLVLTGHSPVFPFTHARNLLYGPSAERQIFYGMVHDAWAFRGEKGAANHQIAMAQMQKSKNYGLQKSAGLDIQEGLHHGDIVLAPESGTRFSRAADKVGQWVGQSRLGKLLRIDPGNAARTMDALKIGRSKLFDYYWERQPPELKTEAYARLLARDMNYATGAVTHPRGEAAMPLDRLVAAASDASGNILLSSKLFYAKRMEAANIFRYGPARLADLLNKGGRMTPEERAIANLGLQRWARITATQLGILGANVLFARAMGLRIPNLTDPDKADWGRLRIGNFVIPLSPLMEAIREPIRAVAVGLKKRSVYEAGKEAVRPAVNALAPGLQLVMEQATGKEPFSGRTVPSVRNMINPPNKSKLPPVTLGEYAATRFSPIAISGALREFYQALRNEGVSGPTAMAFIKAAAGGITSGFAGTHVYEETPKKKEKRPKTLSEGMEDLRQGRIKKFLTGK
jgi:hypothetical protein